MSMEERQPLDRRSLKHTSKEPEAQVWAKIGTDDYDPLVAKSDAKKDEPTSPLEGYHIPKLSQKSGSSEADVDIVDYANSEDELRVDETAESLQVEDSTKEDGEQQENGDGEKKSGMESSSERKSSSPEKGDRKQDRSRSSSRERRSSKSEDFRTNSSDPKMIKSRIFVGHLNTDKATQEDVEKIFTPYGKILGVTLQSGYGFVQFNNEESAAKAIKEAHGTPLFGTKIVVDRTVAHKKLLGEDPDSSAHPGHHSSRKERAMLDELDYLRRRDMYDRFARLEELERYYYDRLSSSSYDPYPPRRGGGGGDPYYDRGYYDHRYHDRLPPPPPMGGGGSYDRYDRYRAPDFERERMRDRYSASSGYDRPRDDPYDYDRRARDPYDYPRRY